MNIRTTLYYLPDNQAEWRVRGLMKWCILRSVWEGSVFRRVFQNVWHYTDWPEVIWSTYRSHKGDIFVADWPTGGLMIIEAVILKCYFGFIVSLRPASLMCSRLIGFIYLFFSSVTVSHHIHGSPVYPGCANGRRAVQLQVYDTPPVHRRDPTEQ